jgi:hypothetical protein
LINQAECLRREAAAEDLQGDAGAGLGPSWGNAVKLGTDREDVDLRRVGVELDFIGRPFDAVTVRPVSLDHSGTCPVSPWAEAFLGDLVDGFGECVGESVRGKSPPG